MAVKSYALTTRQRLKDFLEVTGDTDAINNIIDRIIDSVTEYIEKYIGFRVKKTAYSNEEYDTDGGDILVLKRFPVSSTDNFTIEMRDSVLNQDDWDTIDSEYYFIDYDSGVVHAASSYRFVKSRRGFRVSYTAGFDFDNTTTFLSDTEGGDLELAAWLLGQYAYDSVGTESAVSSERIGDYAVTYAKGTMFNEDIKNILDKYAIRDNIGILTPDNV